MASSAKGTLWPARINEVYPNQVTIEGPWNGLGVLYTQMFDWVAKRTRDGHLVVCFADQSTAADFNVQFGGTLVSLLL